MPQNKVFTYLLLLLLFYGCAEEYVVVDKNEMSPLYIISTIPQNGAKDVKRDLYPTSGVVINFSKGIDERYAREDYFDFTCNGIRVDSKLTLSEDKKSVTLKLKQGVLLPEMAYCRVVISKLIRDHSNQPLYLSESSYSSLLSEEDGGVVDAEDDASKGGSSYRETRSGEGDYILEFFTEYEPLRIESIYPEDGSKVDLKSFNNVRLIFNKDLDEESVNPSNFIIQGEPVSVTFDGKKEVSISPLNPLKEGRRYNIIVMPFVRDRQGVILNQTYHFYFETLVVLPEVVSIFPYNESQIVDPALKEVRIEFNKEMNPDRINNNTISISGVESYSVRYSDKVAYIEGFSLKEATEYVVIVSSALEDTGGFHLRENYYSRFKTAFDRPSVSSIFPAYGAKDVPSNIPSIDIVFSEDMDFTHIDNSLFEINPDVPFEVQVLDGKSVKLKLKSALLAGNKYTIRISDYLSDISGIRMEKDYVSYFTVSSTPDNNPPSPIVLYYRQIDNPPEDERRGFILEWKAPAADLINGNYQGKVKAYSMAYSDSPFGIADFDRMKQLFNIPTPQNPGDVQNITLYSLIDKDNNEEEIIYNKPYYFMLRATDGTNFAYSNLVKAGILIEHREISRLSKFAGLSVKYLPDFNGEDLFAIGDTDEVRDGEEVGSVIVGRVSEEGIEELFRLYGETEGSLFGYQIEYADINGDGCRDLIVSAPLEGENREGAIYIYAQKKIDSRCEFSSDQALKIKGDKERSLFGFRLKKFIMNEKEHLMVGAPFYGDLNSGALFIYLNRSSLADIPQSGDILIKGLSSGSMTGYAIESGDFNNDGCPDIVISAPDAISISRGAVYILYSSSFVGGCQIRNTDLNNADVRITGGSDYTRLGYNLLVVDLNGDKRPELVMSGMDKTGGSGVVFIRNGKDGNTLKIDGEPDGNFGSYLTYADDFRVDGCKDNPNNKGCKDLVISDEKRGTIYLLEGLEEINLIRPIPIRDDSYPSSFGYSIVVFRRGLFEDILVSAPYSTHFDDFVSRFYILK